MYSLIVVVDVVSAWTLTREIYYDWHHRIIENALKRNAYILVAYPKGSPEVIVGYACVENDALHYVYVKKAFQQMNIATTMLKGLHFKYYTHRTDDTKYLMSLIPEAIYNPYLL